MRKLLKLLILACLITVSTAYSCGKNGGTGNQDPPPPEGVDTYGYITDASGNPVEGVVVSDGFSCVATDGKGQYGLNRNAEADFVFYSLPSGYGVNLHKTYQLPQLYSALKAGTARYDFTLTALNSPETRFDLICIGDPQVNDEANVGRFNDEVVPDIKAYVSSAGVPCYAINLGDLVNNKWALFRDIVLAMQPDKAGVPVFSTIGNHDHEFGTAISNEKEGRAKYESFFGPANYSFNRGDVHIVSMDNIIHGLTASPDYVAGFTAGQYEWLRQDLSYVPKDKMVILCVHIPFRTSSFAYSDEVLNLLSQYSYAAIMSAHTHSNINHIHKKNGKEIFEHVTGTTCGAWWRSTVCTEGTPIGYGIYRIDGNKMKEWSYKSVRHDEDFQIRLYRASDKFTGGGNSYGFSKTGANQIIANVWNWDPRWTVSVYENGVKTGNMTPYTEKDAWTLAYHLGTLASGSSYDKSSAHMLHYTLTNVLAEVKVEAVDGFGNTYQQTVFTGPDSNPGVYHSDY